MGWRKNARKSSRFKHTNALIRVTGRGEAMHGKEEITYRHVLHSPLRQYTAKLANLDRYCIREHLNIFYHHKDLVISNIQINPWFCDFCKLLKLSVMKKWWCDWVGVWEKSHFNCQLIINCFRKKAVIDILSMISFPKYLSIYISPMLWRFPSYLWEHIFLLKAVCMGCSL